MQKVQYLKDHHKLKATVLSYILVSLAGLATDIYLPSMPHMATSLHVNDQQVQLTLSSFLISYGVSQFFVAPYIGGYLEHFFSWRVKFYFLGIYSGLIFICEIFYSGETLNNFSKFKIKNVVSSYKVLLTFLFGPAGLLLFLIIRLIKTKHYFPANF